MDTKDQKEQRYQTGGWRAHWILIISSLLFVIAFMDRQVLAIVLQPMKIDLGLTDAEIGITMTFFTLVIALLAFPIAYIVDTWSRKKAMSIMAVIWSIFTYVTGLAKNFMGILVPRIFVAVGESAFTAAGTALITAAYPPQKHGRVIGIFNMAFPIGAALGMAVGGLISVKYGWRTPFFIFAVPGIILAIAALFLKDYKTVSNVDEAGGKQNFFKCAQILLKTPTMRWYLFGYGMMMIMGNAFGTWLPAYVMREGNVKEDVAGIIAAAAMAPSVLGVFGGGWISDVWQKKNRRARLLLPAIALIVAAVLLAISVLVLKSSMSIFIAVFCLFSLIYYMAVPSLATVSQEIVPPSLKGMSYGMMLLCAYILGGGWSPWAIGVISDALGNGGLKIALLLSCIGGVVGAFLFFMASRHYAQDLDNVKDKILECAS